MLRLDYEKYSRDIVYIKLIIHAKDLYVCERDPTVIYKRVTVRFGRKSQGSQARSACS